MLNDELKNNIGAYEDFPRKGILFRDISPILRNPELFSKLIKKMSKSSLLEKAECIVAVDARGFIFASCIASNLSKPFVLARKPGKLPGKLIESSYQLEYGENSLSLQLESLKPFKSFGIVDDLLATGGTVSAIANLLTQNDKIITGLSVVVELSELKGRSNLDFEVSSEIIY